LKSLEGKLNILSEKDVLSWEKQVMHTNVHAQATVICLLKINKQSVLGVN